MEPASREPVTRSSPIRVAITTRDELRDRPEDYLAHRDLDEHERCAQIAPSTSGRAVERWVTPAGCNASAGKHGKTRKRRVRMDFSAPNLARNWR
jgi:hypothetical protein